jgi:hypothetical protein
MTATRQTGSGTGTRGRPWLRALGAGAAGVAPPVVTGFFHPHLGTLVVGMEVTLVALVVLTALFGPERSSERAFRFLRWLANQPEPRAPTPIPAARRPPTAGSHAAKSASRLK